LAYCLLHWITGVQITDLSIRDGQVFSLSGSCLLEVSTSQTSFGLVEVLSGSLSFQSVNKTPSNFSRICSGVVQILKHFEPDTQDPNCLGQASPFGSTCTELGNRLVLPRNSLGNEPSVKLEDEDSGKAKDKLSSELE